MPGPLGTNALTLSTLYLYPFQCPKFTLQTVGLEVTTAATAGGVLRAGWYGGWPSQAAAADVSQLSLLADLGTVISTAAGAVTLPTALAAPGGVLWFAVVAQVAACTMRIQTTGHGIPLPFATPAETPGVNGARMGFALAGVTGALPASGALAVNNNPPPKFFLRRSVT
jgi:hypothetical protein